MWGPNQPELSRINLIYLKRKITSKQVQLHTVSSTWLRSKVDSRDDFIMQKMSLDLVMFSWKITFINFWFSITNNMTSIKSYYVHVQWLIIREAKPCPAHITKLKADWHKKHLKSSTSSSVLFLHNFRLKLQELFIHLHNYLPYTPHYNPVLIWSRSWL